MFTNKAQGAIEYLLVIGAAILVVAIVVIAITSITQNTPNTNKTEVEIINDPLLLKTYEARGFTAMRISGGDSIFVTYKKTEPILKEELEKKIENGVIKNFFDGAIINSEEQVLIQIIDPEKIIAIQNETLELKDFTDATTGYIQINSCQDFFNINNNLSGKYMLMKDITLTKNCDGTTILDTMVIPTTFSGELDGLGHTLNYQMEITNPIPTTADTYYGLIKETAASAKIKNVNIQANVNNKLNYSYTNPTSGKVYYTRTGGLVGLNYGLIENIKFTGNVEGPSHVGGIIGYNGKSSAAIIKNVEMNGTVKTTVGGYAGGIIGVYNFGEIINATNNASVTGKSSIVGGIVGLNYKKIENSVNNGEIYSPSDVVGGIAGYNYSHPEFNTLITNSINNGNVSGNNYVGGIAGSLSHMYNSTYFTAIENSINNGTIKAIINYPGGITGRIYFSGAGTIERKIELKNNTNNGTIIGSNKSYLTSYITKAGGDKDPKDAMKRVNIIENINQTGTDLNCIGILATIDTNFSMNINNIGTCS